MIMLLVEMLLGVYIIGLRQKRSRDIVYFPADISKLITIFLIFLHKTAFFTSYEDRLAKAKCNICTMSQGIEGSV